MNITHEGTVYTYKPEHGAWFSDPQHERIGTLVIPANADGSPAVGEVGDIEMSYYESGGVCEARCALCEYHEAREWRDNAEHELWEARDSVRVAHERLTAVNSTVR